MITETIIATIMAGSAVCSDFYDTPDSWSRINPTTLTEHQQCVNIVHDRNFGEIGRKHYWVRSGMDFYYIEKDKLKGKTHSQIQNILMQEIVSENINQEIVDLAFENKGLMSIAEFVPSAAQRLAENERRIAELQVSVALLTADKAALEVSLTDMTADRDRLQALLDQANLDIAALEAQQSQLQSNVHEVFEDYLPDFLTDNNIITADQLFKANGALTSAASSALFAFLDQAVADANALAEIKAEMKKSKYGQFDYDDDITIAQNVRSLLSDNEFNADMLDTIKADMESFTGFTWDGLAGWSGNWDTFVAMVEQMETDIASLEADLAYAKQEADSFNFFSWDNDESFETNIDNFITLVDSKATNLTLVDNALTAVTNTPSLTVNGVVTTWANLTRSQKVQALDREITRLNVMINNANAIASDGFAQGANLASASDIAQAMTNSSGSVSTGTYSLIAGQDYAYSVTPTETLINAATGSSVTAAELASTNTVDFVYHTNTGNNDPLATGWYVAFDNGNGTRINVAVGSEAEAEAMIMQISNGGLDVLGVLQSDGVTIYGVTHAMPTTLAELKTIIDEVAADAFEAGYSVGYADGYKAGYEQGFADGVASVQGQL